MPAAAVLRAGLLWQQAGRAGRGSRQRALRCSARCDVDCQTQITDCGPMAGPAPASPQASQERALRTAVGRHCSGARLAAAHGLYSACAVDVVRSGCCTANPSAVIESPTSAFAPQSQQAASSKQAASKQHAARSTQATDAAFLFLSRCSTPGEAIGEARWGGVCSA